MMHMHHPFLHPPTISSTCEGEGVHSMADHQQIAHGSGQMRAQSISIQLSTRERCTAGCKFCISRTTPGTEVEDEKLVKLCGLKRLRVGLRFAERTGATHAILTGRADPSQEKAEYLVSVVKECSRYLPLVDMHTNGYLFQPNLPPSISREYLLPDLVNAGLTMITLSIASHDFKQNRELMLIKKSPAELIQRCRSFGLMVRASLVINKSGVKNTAGILEYIRVLGNLGVQMVVIREVWRPESVGRATQEVIDWNATNWIDIAPLQTAFTEFGMNKEHGVRIGNPLPWGTPVFLVGGIFDEQSHGVNVTFARCEEANGGTVMKSIVHKPDGHGYRNWDHNGDILY
ncbi:hypothetical protein A3E97_01380 [Candidatus Uhrbacteria bacterium RIFCSPHIGHO2_12_FULL_47_12]|nr:MAG: hypothetical protein A3E97_01380 [Candidatus Uhrbacteria bacterium RIFCSPHIGHO2_12_FULL_47_12]OGL80695.1 MAG: hypothetical protein A3B20_04870 [Candidatus Uhrbacteria bacterium RIFCSPLOWO2_01_FULL_47_17]